MRFSTIFLFGVCAACRPPEAPSGLNESARYIVQNFYEEDDVVALGLSGWLSWFDAEGEALLDTESEEYQEGYELETLNESDVASLTLEPGNDLAKAKGIVAVAELPCSIHQVESFLLRKDQATVLPTSFVTYERQFFSSRTAFEEATQNADYPKQNKAISIQDEDFKPVETASVLLLTDNIATSKSILSVTYDLKQHFRHGRFLVEESDVSALLSLGYVPNRDSMLKQQYSLEVYVERGENSVLRLFSLWFEPYYPDIALKQAKGTADRLAELCRDDSVLPAEGELAITSSE